MIYARFVYFFFYLIKNGQEIKDRDYTRKGSTNYEK